MSCQSSRVCECFATTMSSCTFTTTLLPILIKCVRLFSTRSRSDRRKRSSLSAALDSIPSCSGGEDEEEEDVETNDDDDSDTNESYTSEEEEDEEYGSYYFGNRTSDGIATPSSTVVGNGLNNQNTTNPKVWRYGEPPTTMDHHSSTATLLKKKQQQHAEKQHRGGISKHDLIMRRDRLLQEEYEYRLRALQRENANLSKKFRIFVLVTVAIIFMGALTFAFVVCVRMLMSI